MARSAPTPAPRTEFFPLQDRVLIDPSEAEDVTPGGIYLPEQAKEKPQQGVILAIGPGKYADRGTHRIRPDVEVGDRVLYTRYSGTEVKSSGQKLLLVKESDLLAVIADAPEEDE